MGEYLREQLHRLRWSVLNPTHVPVMCFWHEDIDQLVALLERERVRFKEDFEDESIAAHSSSQEQYPHRHGGEGFQLDWPAGNLII